MDKIGKVVQMYPEDIVKSGMTDYLFDPSVQVTQQIYRKRIKVAKKTLQWHIEGEKTQPTPMLQRAVDEFMLKSALTFAKKGDEYVDVGMVRKKIRS